MTQNPSKIPLPANKTIPKSLSALSLSDLQSPSKASSVHDGTSPITPIGVGGRRLSLINGHGSGYPHNKSPSSVTGRTSRTSKRESISENIAAHSDDPVILRTQILSLKAALESAKKKLSEVENTRSDSPILPDIPSVTPLKVSLIGESRENGQTSPLDYEPPTSGSRPSSRGLPYSKGSYDLKCRASIPKYDGRSREPASLASPMQNADRSNITGIPQAVISQATALHPTPPISSPSRSSAPSPSRSPTPNPDSSLRSPFFPPSSPQSFGEWSSPSPQSLSHEGYNPSPRSVQSGRNASTRVIDSLQTELLSVKSHLERVKTEVRAGQRRVEQLTRQKEDLQETKERMRVENGSLNNVIARKERLLQEVLERARTAETSLKELQQTRKSLEQSTKKQVQEMTQQMNDARVEKTKAERECVSLRDGVKSLRDVWAREVKTLKEEMRRKEEEDKKEMEEARNKYTALKELIEAQSAERVSTQELINKALSNYTALHDHFETETSSLRARAKELEDVVDKQAKENVSALQQVGKLAGELQRLRRLMREMPNEELDKAMAAGNKINDKSVEKDKEDLQNDKV
ncbi:uveal autoantigen with coiled-coil domains and ankyrin repeats protein [Cryptococcus gattii E566]|uniref:SWI5-dependent HO expression protein 3 n=2 Tax=Cryptococcus gattii TaxID=37769 RepID=E6RFE6_CRYGW|nr:Hypothetical protein CGB_M2480W [Cryptococcus gattii WM276]ADV25525.1 Hypothetical protein CGB_M2480W [Cryptococcus gattii WM276]KIR78809.1 uveal autoantigen with coiled-coil domains and ankyrin repeats protein [Cryptococcus gattii EJB2]KIY32851.1 uveal autoantigen with coiled-coil domains and ankyrin repeats protein [Cryptococcus gattii E566]KJE05085.1 uveal autoantigen with coiled-coil domains and ankyrin repeats protein [Cryptococcus gattii NT-10]